MATEPPPLCPGCGHDVPRRASGVCPRCGTDTNGTRFRRVAGSKPARFELHDDSGAKSVVTMNGRLIATASGHRRVVWLLRGFDLPQAFEHLGSRRLVPFPLDAELAADIHEIAAGAFVCAVLGLAKRGALEISFDDWIAWERNGPFVVPVTLEARCHVQLRLVSPRAEPLPPLETLLLEAVSETARSHGYRSRAPEWCALDQALGAVHGRLPSKHRIAEEATFTGFEDEHALEAVTTAYPRLVGALVAAAKCLPP